MEFTCQNCGLKAMYVGEQPTFVYIITCVNCEASHLLLLGILKLVDPNRLKFTDGVDDEAAAMQYFTEVVSKIVLARTIDFFRSKWWKRFREEFSDDAQSEQSKGLAEIRDMIQGVHNRLDAQEEEAEKDLHKPEPEPNDREDENKDEGNGDDTIWHQGIGDPDPITDEELKNFLDNLPEGGSEDDK